MTARRNLDNYPPEFQKVTEAAIKFAQTAGLFEDGTAVIRDPKEPLLRLPTASQGQAVNLMMQLRQYWTALASAAPRLTIIDPRHALMPYLSQLAVRAKKDRPEVVEILHRSQLEGSKMLGNVLASADFKNALAAATKAIEAPNEVRPLPAATTGQFRDVMGNEMSPGDQRIMKAAQDKVLEDLYGVKPAGK